MVKKIFKLFLQDMMVKKIFKLFLQDTKDSVVLTVLFFTVYLSGETSIAVRSLCFLLAVISSCTAVQ